MPEAELVTEGHGLVPQGPGWFVVNAQAARWRESSAFGAWAGFEGKGDASFTQLGINVHVLQPGQPSCRYHQETMQENFFVLQGECTLLIDGQERALSVHDFVHCPPGTAHVFVGRGSGPCAILCVGARADDSKVHYPVSELAERHGASAASATDVPAEAYADVSPPTEVPSPWPL